VGVGGATVKPGYRQQHMVAHLGPHLGGEKAGAAGLLVIPFRPANTGRTRWSSRPGGCSPTAILGIVPLRRRARAQPVDKRLDEYDFYPFITDEAGLVQFSPERFEQGVEHLLSNRNSSAARELIVIGEQNLVRDTFASAWLARYKLFYETYGGDDVINNNEVYLENYKRIVQLIGRSFPNTGIEILLHNLVNPARSIVAIENGAVTGRTLEMGTTKLVLDLKTRRQRGQDKLNYRITLGARQFKCTTIPIFRPEYGLVGAICINIDERFLREEVMPNPERLAAFMDNFLKMDMDVEENILSAAEYRAALNGKRHFLDDAIRSGSAASSRGRALAAILFSDIRDSTEMMNADQETTLATLADNGRIHRQLIARHRGRFLKEMGDGVLASFTTATQAVQCALDLQREIRRDGRYSARIGIHLGEIVQADGDVYGDGVNIAARVNGEAEPGGIVVTDVVFDNVRSLEGVTGHDLGLRTLKGIPGEVRLWNIEV
jgi:class 3 adenylate cyclase